MTYADLKTMLGYLTTEELHEFAEDLQAIVDGDIVTAGTILSNAEDSKVMLQLIDEIVAE